MVESMRQWSFDRWTPPDQQIHKPCSLTTVINHGFAFIPLISDLNMDCARRNQMEPSHGKFSLTLKKHIAGCTVSNQMEPSHGKFSLMPKKHIAGCTGSSFLQFQNSSLQDPIYISSSSSSSSSSSNDSDDERDQSNGNASKQLIPYEPPANDNAINLVPSPLQCEFPLHSRTIPTSSAPRVLPSVGGFTVQCALCFKWRLIPTKEKYEEIREHILEQPFVCEMAREWRPDVTCDDPEDVSQDDSRLWAIDKPSIAQPPPGWQRLLRIRGEGSTKFADIYYVAPSGKRLRSMVEIKKYLMEHPEYLTDGVDLSRFSFQIPKPLQENYVRKKKYVKKQSTLVRAPFEGNRTVEPEEVSPLAWAGPDEDCTGLQNGGPGLPAPWTGSPASDPIGRPAKRQATKRSFRNLQ